MQKEYTIYVSNINPTTTEIMLYNHFYDFAPSSVCIPASNKKSVFFGFVNFSCEETQKRAIFTLNESILNGNTIILRDKPKTPSPLSSSSSSSSSSSNNNNNSKIEPNNLSLYVNKLCKIKANEETLREYFSAFNPKKTAVSKGFGFGFVDFYNIRDRDNALVLNDTIFQGRKIEVSIKRAPSPKKTTSSSSFSHPHSRNYALKGNDQMTYPEQTKMFITDLQHKYFVFISNEKLKKIERAYEKSKICIVYPDRNGPSFHENILRIETVHSFEFNDSLLHQIFGEGVKNELTPIGNLLIFQDKERANEILDKFNEKKILGEFIKLTPVSITASLLIKTQTKEDLATIKESLLELLRTFIEFDSVVEYNNTQIKSSSCFPLKDGDYDYERMRLSYIVKRYQQEKLFCEDKINATCHINEMDGIIKIKYGAFKRQKILNLINHFEKSISKESFVIIKWNPGQDFKPSFMTNKELLMMREQEYRLSIYRPKDKETIFLTGQREKIDRFIIAYTPKNHQYPSKNYESSVCCLIQPIKF